MKLVGGGGGTKVLRRGVLHDSSISAQQRAEAYKVAPQR